MRPVGQVYEKPPQCHYSLSTAFVSGPSGPPPYTAARPPMVPYRVEQYIHHDYFVSLSSGLSFISGALILTGYDPLIAVVQFPCHYAPSFFSTCSTPALQTVKKEK